MVETTRNHSQGDWAPDPAALRELVDRSAIEQALYRWSRGVGRRDWALVRAAFHDDARDDHGTFDGGIDGFVDWQKAHHEHIERSMHLIGNILIEFASPDVALVESYVTVLQRFSAEARAARIDILGEAAADDAVPYDMVLVGRYLDRFERRAGAWRIAYRALVFETIRGERASGPDLKLHWLASRRDEGDRLHALRAELGLGVPA